MSKLGLRVYWCIFTGTVAWLLYMTWRVYELGYTPLRLFTVVVSFGAVVCAALSVLIIARTMDQIREKEWGSGEAHDQAG